MGPSCHVHRLRRGLDECSPLRAGSVSHSSIFCTGPSPQPASKTVYHMDEWVTECALGPLLHEPLCPLGGPPPHTHNKKLVARSQSSEEVLSLEARSHVDDDGTLPTSEVWTILLPNLLSANASGYASTVCRLCSCSTFTFPFPWWPDLCGRVGAHRTARAGMVSLKADSARRSFWQAALQAVRAGRERSLRDSWLQPRHQRCSG